MATFRVCAIQECGKRVKARGLCPNHYIRELRTAQPAAGAKVCSVKGCGMRHESHGYCHVHYKRHRRNGDANTIQRHPKGALRKFIDGAIESETTNCIVWPSKSKSEDYVTFLFEGRKILAHHYVCRLAHGEPAFSAADAAHSCGVRRCINPKHLRWATRRENAADMVGHGTRLVGERHGMAKLTDEMARTIKYAEGNHTEVARRFGVNRETARDIRNGKRWRHV